MGWPKSQWPEFRLLLDPIDFLVPQVWSARRPALVPPAKKGARVAQSATRGSHPGTRTHCPAAAEAGRVPGRVPS